MSPASGVQLQHFESATGPGFDAQELTEGPGTPPTPRWSMGVKVFLVWKEGHRNVTQLFIDIDLSIYLSISLSLYLSIYLYIYIYIDMTKCNNSIFV